MPVNYYDLIEVLFASCGYSSFLELGVAEGELTRRMARRAALVVAVDVRPVDLPGNVIAHWKTTDEYFSGSSEGPFDMIFVDADHSFASAWKDMEAALRNLSPGGTVVLHDTDPESPKLLDPGYCGDSYRLVSEVLAHRDDLHAVTLPVGPPGLTLVRRSEDRRVLGFVPRLA